MDAVSVLTAALIVAGFPAIALVAGALLGSEGPGLEALFRQPWDMAWPRGMQEEEPIHYRLEPEGQRAFQPTGRTTSHARGATSRRSPSVPDPARSC